MKIVSHKLIGVSYRAAQSAGGEMKPPTVIVIHDTAGRLDKFSSVRWFESPDCNTSAHFVVERDGTIVQMVACNRKAWHCGPSSFEGREGVNSFGIGIEVVNPGKLDKDGRAWFHRKGEKGFDAAHLQHVKTKAHGDGYWMAYTAEQIESVTVICKALALAYPIKAITTHYEISPGRKIDPNPLYPLEELRAAVFAPAPAEEPAEAEVVISETVSAPPPQTTKPVPVMQAMGQSKSLVAILLAAVNLMIANFTSWMHTAWDFLLWLLGVLPAITAEVKGTLSSSQDVASWFHLDWASISVTLALVTLAIVFVRHLAEKRKTP